MSTLYETAIGDLKRSQENGWKLEQLIGKTLSCSVSPGDPVMYVYRGNRMYLDRAGDVPIKLKAYQMGVVFLWRDGRAEHAIFDIRELWDDIVNPKPKQLSFWDGEAVS